MAVSRGVYSVPALGEALHTGYLTESPQHQVGQVLLVLFHR